MSADLPAAIQCLEYELGATLDRAAELSLAIRTLRDLRLAPSSSESATPAPPAPAASSEPAAPDPLVRPPATGTPPDPVKIPTSGPLTERPERTARASTPKEPPADSAPAGGIPRPESFGCMHCDRAFPTKQGLSLHITRTHPIERKPFDPDAARARAAGAVDGNGGISKMTLGRPKETAA